jgi:hypothetical protein
MAVMGRTAGLPRVFSWRRSTMSKLSRRSFFKDLTRVRHMSTVSAVVLGTTFMPLLGVPQAYELDALSGAVESFSDTRADVLAPRRDDEAARARSADSVIAQPRAHRSSFGSAREEPPVRVIRAVEHENDAVAEMLETTAIEPLPPEDLEALDPALPEALATREELDTVVEETPDDLQPAADADEKMASEPDVSDEENLDAAPR